jgi:uncharacterized surface protein with fasciclin (FAS1) repeats
MSLTTLLTVVLLIAGSPVRSETVLDSIRSHPNLTTFLSALQKDQISELWLQTRTATVLAPTNAAFEAYLSRGRAIDNNIAPYHIVGAIVYKHNFPTIMSSTKPIAAPLAFTFRDPHPEAPGIRPHQPHHHEDSQQRQYFVDNAKIIDVKTGFRSESEGLEQVLYVIDEVLEPFIPRDSGIAPTANEFIQGRIHYNNVDTPSETFASLVRQHNLEGLFDRPGNNTFFIPRITGNENYRITNLDADTVRAHVVPNRALYFRTIETNTEYRTSAWNDKLQVGVSLPETNTSTKAGTRIQSRTHKSENRDHHIGLVRTGIVTANIPVRNGVVHIIESPLMVVDITIWDFIEANRDGQISRFADLLSNADNVLNRVRDSSRTLTIFAPNNAAFAKIEKEKLDSYLNDPVKARELIALHVVEGLVNTEQVKTGKVSQLQSLDEKRDLYFGIGMPTDTTQILTVEGGGVNSTAIQADIGTTNGVFHIVDKVLGIPYQTMHEKLHDDFDLQTTYLVGSHRNDFWHRKLDEKSQNFTYFAPSRAAWKKLKVEMPSEYKQLTQGLLPIHGENVSHVSFLTCRRYMYHAFCTSCQLCSV